MRLRPASHRSSVCTVPSSHAKESGAVGSSWYLVRVRDRVRVRVRVRVRQQLVRVAEQLPRAVDQRHLVRG